MGLQTCVCRDCEGDGEFVKYHVLRTVITKELCESLSPARCQYKKENSLTKQWTLYDFIMMKRPDLQNRDYCMLSLWRREQPNKTMNTAWFHYDEKTCLTKQRLYTARYHYEEEEGVLPNTDYCTLSLWWRKQPKKTTDYCKLSLRWKEGNLTKQRLVHVVIMWKRKES